MKKTVSVLLSVLMLFLCIPFYTIASDNGAQPTAENLTQLGAVIGSSDSLEEYSKAVDGDRDTFWQPTAEGEYVGFDFSKEKNGRIETISVNISLSEAEGGSETVYTVQYFRNNRWYDLLTFKDSDAIPQGYDTYEEAIASCSSVKADYMTELDEPVITQKLRVKVSGIEDSSVMPRIYEITAHGQMLENVAIKGKAYASSFKHFDWTPPTSGNDGLDFEEDWHGWEPQYPDVTAGSDTSSGFSGEYWGLEFKNKKYFEISELVLYMSVHNSYAEPSMGYQNTKYKVEALCEGEWVVIAEFSDSDSLPRDYDTYADAMANDTGAHHIASYYTKILDTPITTNNIKITVSEFAKNYQGEERLVFPYIYEVRAYGVSTETPDIELPQGAEYSTDATSNAIPYASSSDFSKYPLLAIDDNGDTGWMPAEKTANQTYGVKLDRVYTINDIYLQFADASFSAPFKVEALVDGSWVKIAEGNVSDAFVPTPDGGPDADQEHTYSVSETETDEIRLVFTAALTDIPEIRELSANIVSSINSLMTENGAVEAIRNSNNSYSGVKFGEAKQITGIALDFAGSANIKYYIQINIDGVWQTLKTVETIEEGITSFEIEAVTDCIRIGFSNEPAAPIIENITVSVFEDSGNMSCNAEYIFDNSGTEGEKASVRLLLGKEQVFDKMILDTEGDFTAEGFNGVGESVFTGSGNAQDKVLEADDVSVKSLLISYQTPYIPHIKELSLDIIGMKTYFLDGRYSVFQKLSAAAGNLSVMGTPYANSNYPAMSFETYINDGEKYDGASVWVPKLEEYSAGTEIFCGIKLYKKCEINKIAVYSTDVGNPAGIGSKFEIQALVNGEYVKISDGYTCAAEGDYCTVYEIDSVKTDDIRLVFVNSGVHFPTVMELEIYSDSEVPTPFVGHPIMDEAPEVTVFKSETPRFEVAGLPNN